MALHSLCVSTPVQHQLSDRMQLLLRLLLPLLERLPKKLSQKVGTQPTAGQSLDAIICMPLPMSQKMQPLIAMLLPFAHQPAIHKIYLEHDCGRS